jgi:hypothetical protein
VRILGLIQRSAELGVQKSMYENNLSEIQEIIGGTGTNIENIFKIQKLFAIFFLNK